GGRRFSADLVPGAPPVPLTLPAAAAPSLHPGFSQTPDRSGCPSKNIGAGAATSTLPSAVLGTPGSGYRGHCAESDAAKTADSIAAPANVSDVFIGQIVPSTRPQRKLAGARGSGLGTRGRDSIYGAAASRRSSVRLSPGVSTNGVARRLRPSSTE